MYKSDDSSINNFNPSEFDHSIIIGSNARGECTDKERIETLIISDTGESWTIECGDESYDIDDVEHLEMLLDAYTTNPSLQSQLIRLKYFLIDKRMNKCLAAIRRNIYLSLQSINNGNKYKLNGQEYLQHTDDKFYISDINHKSVKFTYLRLFQNIVLYLLISKCSSKKLYFEEQPTLESKLNYLCLEKIIDDNLKTELLNTYDALLHIYYTGLRLYRENIPGEVISYEIRDSRSTIDSAQNLINKLMEMIFTN